MTLNQPQLHSSQLAQDLLVLGSELADMERIAPWVASLAERHAISERTAFAMNLCLEEAVSNVIRHGYANQRGGAIEIHFSAPRADFFLLTIEDQTAPFDPLAQEPLPLVGQQDPNLIGGQGIRLMRGFASQLEYESTPTGNRLRIGFAAKP